MKKKIIITSVVILALCGCKQQPKTYGTITDYSAYDTEDYHVVYAWGDDGVYSDGSFDSNLMFNDWVSEYESGH